MTKQELSQLTQQNASYQQYATAIKNVIQTGNYIKYTQYTPKKKRGNYLIIYQESKTPKPTYPVITQQKDTVTGMRELFGEENPELTVEEETVITEPRKGLELTLETAE